MDDPRTERALEGRARAPEPAEAGGGAPAPAAAEAPDGERPDRAEVEPGGILLLRYHVDAHWHGLRLDRFLQRRIKRLSRARIQRIIETQVTTPDGRPAKPARVVVAGEQYLLRRPLRAEPVVPRDFTVLYDDGRVLAVDKPAGLPMHPTARYHHNTLTAVLRERFPGEPLQIAHRLDRETSGVVLVGRGPVEGARLKRAFAARRVHKRYLALVHGVVGEDAFDVELPLHLADGPLHIKMEVRPIARGGLAARTRVRVVERLAAHTVLACEPVTGRQHQLRAHLCAVGHPIVGDKLYPDVRRFLDYIDHGMSAALLAELGHERQALHAGRIAFPGADGVERVVEAPLAPDLAALLEALRR